MLSAIERASEDHRRANRRVRGTNLHDPTDLDDWQGRNVLKLYLLGESRTLMEQSTR